MIEDRVGSWSIPPRAFMNVLRLNEHTMNVEETR